MIQNPFEYDSDLLEMHRDFAPAQKPPVRPACGRNMKFARLAVEQSREVGLITFECVPCRVCHTRRQLKSGAHMPSQNLANGKPPAFLVG